MLNAVYCILTERATSEKNTSEDWGQIMDICDRVKENNSGPRDCLKSIARRLNSENPRVVLQAITVSFILSHTAFIHDCTFAHCNALYCLEHHQTVTLFYDQSLLWMINPHYACFFLAATGCLYQQLWP